MDKPILVSACLAGLPTDWRGGASPVPWIVEAVASGRAVAVCPEQLGDLPTPRPPAERCGDCVMTIDGDDVTEAFERGAAQTLAVAREHGCEVAVLRSRSPSCGVGEIRDGTFSKKLVAGDGVTAALLRQHGLTVLTEREARREDVINESPTQ